MRLLRRPRPARAALAASLSLPLLLAAGCGDDAAAPAPEQQDALQGVEVVGEADSPELEVETPVTVTETVTEVVEEGDADGRVVETGDLVAMDVLAVDASTGEVLESTYQAEANLALLADPTATVPGLVSGVVGQTVGSRVLVGVTPEDFGAGGAGGATTAPSGFLLLVDVLGASPVLEGPEGEELPAPEGDAPAELRVETLVEGTGDPLAAGDSAVVDYTGVLWSDGSVFDSSRGEGRTPFTFTVGQGQVIPAWDEGLAGVPVGSRVMVVAPPDQAYGDQETGSIPPGSTLVFVVDVLAAESTTR